MGEAFAYLGSLKWDLIQPKISAAIEYLKSKGATKIGMVGFCWGGWVVAQASAMTADITVGVIPHPSITVEDKLFGKSSAELVSQACLYASCVDSPNNSVFSTTSVKVSYTASSCWE